MAEEITSATQYGKIATAAKQKYPYTKTRDQVHANCKFALLAVNVSLYLGVQCVPINIDKQSDCSNLDADQKENTPVDLTILIRKARGACTSLSTAVVGASVIAPARFPACPARPSTRPPPRPHPCPQPPARPPRSSCPVRPVAIVLVRLVFLFFLFLCPAMSWEQEQE